MCIRLHVSGFVLIRCCMAGTAVPFQLYSNQSTNLGDLEVLYSWLNIMIFWINLWIYGNCQIVRVNGVHKHYQYWVQMFNCCNWKFFSSTSSDIQISLCITCSGDHTNTLSLLVPDGWLCFPYSKLSSGQVVLSSMSLVWPPCLTKPHVFHVPGREQAETWGLI